MPRNSSPIRWEVINEIRIQLKAASMTDAPTDIQMFHTFRERTKIQKGVSFKEMCIIYHGDRCYRDNAGNVVVPSKVEHLMRQEINNFRDRMNYNTIILYCITDDITGWQLYFNISTMELLDVIDKETDRIVKGINKKKKKRHDVFKMTKAERRRAERNEANEHRRKIIDEIKKKMELERQAELERLLKQREEEEQRRLEEQERQEKEEEKGGDENNDNNNSN